jgi:hypothetical protein
MAGWGHTEKLAVREDTWTGFEGNKTKEVEGGDTLMRLRCGERIIPPRDGEVRNGGGHCYG